MKRQILIGAAMSLLLGAQSPAVYGQTGSPSLEETAKFLKDKIDNFTSYSTTEKLSERLYHKGRIKISVEQFEGCSVKLAREQTWQHSFSDGSSGREMQIRDSYSFQLGDLDASQGVVEYDSEHYKVTLKSKGQQPRFRWRSSTTGSEGLAEKISIIHFSRNEKEMADRVAKAFRHAITLCSKSEPF